MARAEEAKKRFNRITYGSTYEKKKSIKNENHHRTQNLPAHWSKKRIDRIQAAVSEAD